MLLVPPDDPDAVASAVIGLLDDPVRAAAIGLRQGELVRRTFALDVVAGQYLRILEKMVAADVLGR